MAEMLVKFYGHGLNTYGYPGIQQIWIWSDIHAHRYFRGRDRARLMDLGMDLVFLYPSKPAPLPSLSRSQIPDDHTEPIQKASMCRSCEK
jgi:hypothetical protein